MYKFFARAGTALAAILGERVISSLQTMLEGYDSLRPEQKQSVDTSLRSQTLAAVAFKRKGLPGVAVLYDLGVVSVADFALYIAANDSYNLPSTSDSRIKDLESNESGDSGSFDLSNIFAFGDSLDSSTNDPETIRRVYTLLTSLQ